MKKIIVLLLTTLLLMTACSNKVDGNEGFAAEDNLEFTQYLDSLLIDSLNEDDISINFTFIDPEAFGVQPKPYELGFTTKEEYEESAVELKALIDELKAFKAKDLSIQQQMDRDALVDLFERSYALTDFYDYEVGTSVLGSSRAFMGNVPAYLEKYEFTKERDVEGYLHFIETLEDSFVQYVNLEKERQTRDTGYSQVELDSIIEQAADMAKLASASDYYLIEDFEVKLNATDFPNKDAYMTRNKEAINGSFVRAYEAVANGLSEIEGPEMRGYASMPNGKEYYLALLQSNTGSSRSIKDVEMITARHKMSSMLATQSLLGSDASEGESEYLTTFIDGPDIPYTDGKSLIDYLNLNYLSYFPKTKNFNYELRRVHESMEEGSSPAFYFSPQIDYNDEYKQVIYAKGEFSKADYKTFGHEATPGHMYQFTYFHDLPSHPIMKLYTSSANAEGWANYSEQYVDLMLDLDPNQANFNKAYNGILQALHIEMDLGINYEGWNIEKFGEYLLGNFGIEDLESVEEMYEIFVHNPATYPTYYLSSIYIEELKNVYLKENADWAYDVDFHEAFLKYGSVGFDIIENGFKKASKK